MHEMSLSSLSFLRWLQHDISLKSRILFSFFSLGHHPRLSDPRLSKICFLVTSLFNSKVKFAAEKMSDCGRERKIAVNSDPVKKMLQTDLNSERDVEVSV